jgi:hypothetical protein
MEKLAREALVKTVAVGEASEGYGEAVATALRLMATLQECNGEVLAGRQAMRSIELPAEELSSILSNIPHDIRVANGLPGGVIYGPVAVNAVSYKVAA